MEMPPFNAAADDLHRQKIYQPLHLQWTAWQKSIGISLLALASCGLINFCVN